MTSPHHNEIREGAEMEAEREQIFQEIYETNNKWLYQYIIRHIGDASCAEDILQDVAIALFFHLDSFLPGYPDNAGQVQTWLVKAARNYILHFWRKYYKLLEMEISTELLPELESQRNEIEDVDLSLPQWLEPRDRKLLCLKCTGYNLKEIAAKLGITYAACRMQNHRLTEKLKKHFKN